MFIVAVNIDGKQFVNNEWKTVRVQVPNNTYHRCRLRLKNITIFAQNERPSVNSPANIVEVRWKGHTEVISFYTIFNEGYAGLRWTQFFKGNLLDLWIAEVHNHAKYVDIEYRYLSTTAATSVLSPDVMQMLFELDI